MHRPFRKSASPAAPRPRASPTLALLAIGLLAVPGVLAGVRPGAPTLLDEVPDPAGLDRHFREYELQVMDPYVFRADLADGVVDLTLRGKAFRVLVERQPWAEELKVGHVEAGGAVRYEQALFAPVAYAGHVEGEPSSFATFVVTGSGVLGRLRTSGDHIAYQPVRFLQPEAPAGLAVVFHVVDHLAPLTAHEHVTPGVDAIEPPALDSGLGAMSYAPGLDRRVTLWADQNMTATPYWSDRLSAEYADMNLQWGRVVGFRFLHDGSVYVCTPCTSEDPGELLRQFAGLLNMANQPWSNYEIALLYTGTFTPGAGGAAWQPGRQAYVQGNMNTSLWRTNTIGHEFGHNFNAWHSRGDSYTHRHANGVLYTHSTLMTGAAGSFPEGVFEFSSTNLNWVRACNLLSWTGSKLPADYPSFGDRCFTGLHILSNGGALPQYDATNYRGKIFTNVPPGDIARICVYGQTAGTVANVSGKPRADSAFASFTVSIEIRQADSWNCVGGPSFWSESSLLLYKSSGNASIGWDSGTPYDGRSSNDRGTTWFTENVRRGYYAEILRGTLPTDPCGALASGASLGRDATLLSCNRAYRLVHQLDGNLVLYNDTSGTKVDWATHTPNQATTSLVMQADGNLVLYRNGGVAWASHTAGNPGAWLSVRDDGTLVIYSATGKTIWFAGCGRLAPDTNILRGNEIRSCDRRFNLAHQTDGNVVLYQNGAVLWATGTSHTGTTEFKMQGDGNLVLYAGGAALWASDTVNNPGSRLVLTDAGKLLILARDGSLVWEKP